MIKFSKPFMGDEEKQAVLKVLGRDRMSDGPEAEKFEDAFAKMHGGHAVAVSSATAGLHLLFLSQRARRLIIPALTHVATAHAALAAGAEIRFADCGDDGNITSATVAAARTGAFKDAKVCAMHYLGKPCAIEADFADSALRIGAAVDCPSVYSFHPAKYMTAGEGGMIVVNNAALAARLRNMRAFGRAAAGSYSVTEFGLNYRMTEMQAAIGIEQLKRLPEWLLARQRNWRNMRAEMPGEMTVIDSSPGSYYALAAIVPQDRDRDDLRAHLLARGIETSVYYPIPVPMQPFYAAHSAQAEFPGAVRIATRSLCYPVAPQIGDAEIEIMMEATKQWLGKRNSE